MSVIDESDDKNIMIIYEWVDSLNLSRPKKNISRDFSDGVLLAEILKTIFPSQVEIHNYPSSNSIEQKQVNWTLLNKKILKKVGIELSKSEISDIVNCKHFAIEQVLAKVYNKVYNLSNDRGKDDDSTIKIKGSTVSKAITKEDIIKNALLDKERVINELNSTLEILQFKLKNSEDENKRIEEKIQQFQMKLNNKNK